MSTEFHLPLLRQVMKEFLPELGQQNMQHSPGHRIRSPLGCQISQLVEDFFLRRRKRDKRTFKVTSRTKSYSLIRILQFFGDDVNVVPVKVTLCISIMVLFYFNFLHSILIRSILYSPTTKSKKTRVKCVSHFVPSNW